MPMQPRERDERTQLSSARARVLREELCHGLGLISIMFGILTAFWQSSNYLSSALDSSRREKSAEMIFTFGDSSAPTYQTARIWVPQDTREGQCVREIFGLTMKLKDLSETLSKKRKYRVDKGKHKFLRCVSSGRWLQSDAESLEFELYYDIKRLSRSFKRKTHDEKISSIRDLCKTSSTRVLSLMETFDLVWECNSADPEPEEDDRHLIEKGMEHLDCFLCWSANIAWDATFHPCNFWMRVWESLDLFELLEKFDHMIDKTMHALIVGPPRRFCPREWKRALDVMFKRYETIELCLGEWEAAEASLKTAPFWPIKDLVEPNTGRCKFAEKPWKVSGAKSPRDRSICENGMSKKQPQVKFHL